MRTILTEKELQEIALKYVAKSYSADQLRYGDDLYDATPDEKDACVDYWSECRSMGIDAFSEKYNVKY